VHTLLLPAVARLTGACGRPKFASQITCGSNVVHTLLSQADYGVRRKCLGWSLIGPNSPLRLLVLRVSCIRSFLEPSLVWGTATVFDWSLVDPNSPLGLLVARVSCILCFRRPSLVWGTAAVFGLVDPNSPLRLLVASVWCILCFLRPPLAWGTAAVFDRSAVDLKTPLSNCLWLESRAQSVPTTYPCTGYGGSVLLELGWRCLSNCQWLKSSAQSVYTSCPLTAEVFDWSLVGQTPRPKLPVARVPCILCRLVRLSSAVRRKCLTGAWLT
jgi:hypothetical protein